MNELLKQIKYNRTPNADIVELLNNLTKSVEGDIIQYGVGERIYFLYYPKSQVLRCCSVKFDNISYNTMTELLEKHTNWYEIYNINRLSEFDYYSL